MPQSLIELGGQSDASIMHVALANGFPPQTYIPMARSFMEDYRVLSFPPRALWGDEDPPNSYMNWSILGDDLLAALSAHQMQDVVAVGHSFGAIGSLLAVIKEPQRFRALIMLDPTMLMPEFLNMINMVWQQNLVDQIPLVQGALRRRREFDSLDDAYERFREKRFFAGWSDEIVRLYAQYGTQPKSNGQGVELAWSPEWEAFYFSTVHNTIWEDLPQLDGLLPTLIIRGGDSDTFVPEAQAKVKDILPGADFAEVAGHGHLFPQSAPDETAKIIQEWLSRL